MSKLLILGNPENRRVEMMSAAWRSVVGGDVVCIAWVDYLQDPDLLDALLGGVSVLKIESSGEDWEVECGMMAMGAGHVEAMISADDARLLSFEKGRIRYQRQWYLGWCEVMRRLEKQLQNYPDLKVMNAPADLAILFDKYEWARRIGEPAGIAMPEKLGVFESFDELMDLTRGRGKFFIKPCHSSSASGVLAVQFGKNRMIAQGAVELCGGKLFNSLKIRKYEAGEVREVIDLLGKERIFAEKWIRKGSVGGRTFDLRVVTVAGVAEHFVMRTSSGPITNLHLGNARGDVKVLVAELGKEWGRVVEIAERTAVLHPRALCLGIDILLAHPSGEPYVIEVNGFGDLLPNVVNSRGDTTYEAQARFYH